MRRASLLLIGMVACLGGSAQSPLVPAARVEHPAINEMSGIVKSRRFPGVYWVHNDSGDRARLFAIRADGSVVSPPSSTEQYSGVEIANARNVDWEDAAIDRDTIYIADVGNNANRRRDLGVYVIREPDPTRQTSVAIVAHLPVVYPDQSEFPPADPRFDCEAVFVFKRKLYFLTKHRDPNTPILPATRTNLYRLDTRFSDRPNRLTKVEGSGDLGGWVTAADLSPDGKTLAVLCQAPAQSVWLFETPRSGDRFLSSKSRRISFFGAKQCEAISWDGPDSLIVTNEQRDVFRIAVREKGE